ncbi:MAG: TRAP transporter large permease subunit, partial [bacterium]
MTLFILLGTMLALAGLGVPLVFSLLSASLVTLLIVRPEIPLALVPQLFVQGMDSFALLAIALFFLAGELMTASGVTDRILVFARALVGHLRGGLAQVGIFSSLVMAGVSGSAVADAAAVGSVLIRAMKKAGYPAAFS